MLKVLNDDKVILSYDAKTVETIKHDTFYKLTIEVTIQNDVFKIFP